MSTLSKQVIKLLSDVVKKHLKLNTKLRRTAQEPVYRNYVDSNSHTVSPRSMFSSMEDISSLDQQTGAGKDKKVIEKETPGLYSR